MANLEDFKRIHEDLVHDYAGDDYLEEFGSMVEFIIALAKQEERERIIALLDWNHNDSDFALCKDYRREEEEALDVPEIRAFLQPK